MAEYVDSYRDGAASVKDDLATIAAKINEIVAVLRAKGIIAS